MISNEILFKISIFLLPKFKKFVLGYPQQSYVAGSGWENYQQTSTSGGYQQSPQEQQSNAFNPFSGIQYNQYGQPCDQYGNPY